MKIRKSTINDINYSYIGEALKERGNRIIFLFSSKIEREYFLPVLLSAVEAVKMGYEIISNGPYRIRREMAKYVLTYGGTMSHVEYTGLKSSKITIDERMEILSGGSVLSFLLDDEKFSMDGLFLSNRKILYTSSMILFIGKVDPYILRDALDLGLETAALKTFLFEKSVRDYAASGGRVLDTFSSWFALPECIAYQDKNGEIKYIEFS